MSLPERVEAGVCLGEVPEKRAWKGSHFCSAECHREYRKQRRSWRAEKACRLCGRRMRQKKHKEAVPSEHAVSHVIDQLEEFTLEPMDA